MRKSTPQVAARSSEPLRSGGSPGFSRIRFERGGPAVALSPARAIQRTDPPLIPAGILRMHSYSLASPPVQRFTYPACSAAFPYLTLEYGDRWRGSQMTREPQEILPPDLPDHERQARARSRSWTGRTPWGPRPLQNSPRTPNHRCSGAWFFSKRTRLSDSMTRLCEG